MERGKRSFPPGRNAMSIFNLNSHNLYRHRMLASAAVAALIASGAAGGVFMTASAPASAAAVMTSDLQSQSLPSFATVVERVKPAVVSVKVKIEEVGPLGRSVRSDGQSAAADSAVLQAVRRSERQPRRTAPNRHTVGAGLRFLHLRRRLCRHQQPRRRARQDRHRDHERRQDLGRQGRSARTRRPIWRC